MAKPKAYCEQCVHYSRRKRSEVCAMAVEVPQVGTESYLHPERMMKEQCWEKNKRNKCTDYKEKP